MAKPHVRVRKTGQKRPRDGAVVTLNLILPMGASAWKRAPPQRSGFRAADAVSFRQRLAEPDLTILQTVASLPVSPFFPPAGSAAGGTRGFANSPPSMATDRFHTM